MMHDLGPTLKKTGRQAARLIRPDIVVLHIESHQNVIFITIFAIMMCINLQEHEQLLSFFFYF